jgi:hypothetical protein
MYNIFKDLGFMVLFWQHKGGIIFRLLCWGVVPYAPKILVVNQSNGSISEEKKP